MLLMLISAGFIAAQSRAGLISLIIGLCVYLIFVGWKTNKRRWVHLMLIIVGFNAIFYSLAKFSSTIVGRIQSIVGTNYLPDGLEGRIDLWMSALQIAKDHPFFGTGIGTFYLMLPSKSSIDRGHVESMAHSDYLQFLSEIGFVGTISFIIALMVYLWIGFKLIKTFKRTEAYLTSKENKIKNVRFDIFDITDENPLWWKYFFASDNVLQAYRKGIGSGIFLHAKATKTPIVSNNTEFFREIKEDLKFNE
ncbi:MAG: O-antigen ligase family protein [Nanoarchaeota archaeon]|nr:O-antigen ligase family protein [Nanoarchaeota archaeon]